MSKENYIICPHCGREYLPCEIFIPKHFIGESRFVERLTDGRIDVVAYKTQPDLSEEYICDSCNKKFKVKAEVEFLVEKDTIGNFEENYTTKLYNDRITLKED